MSVAAPQAPREAPAAGIGALVERYDPDVVDLRGGRATVRLEIEGGRAWDALLTRRALKLEEAGEPIAVERSLRVLRHRPRSISPLGAPVDVLLYSVGAGSFIE